MEYIIQVEIYVHGYPNALLHTELKANKYNHVMKANKYNHVITCIYNLMTTTYIESLLLVKTPNKGDTSMYVRTY